MRTNSFTFLLLLALGIWIFPNPSTAQQFSEWSEPVNLGPPINSKYDDLAAVISPDGLTMYFTSTRPGSAGEDLWIAHRAAPDIAWRTPVNVGPVVNSLFMERLRSVSDDGLVILFQSNRPGGYGSSDIWAAVRSTPKDDFGWGPPVNLGPVINTSANEVAANYVIGQAGFDGELVFASARPGGFGGADLYMSSILFGGGFGTPMNITELNSEYNESCMWMRDDRLEIIFSSTRAGLNNDLNSFDLWTSRRASVWSAWAAPVSLGTINSSVLDVNPSVSADGTTLTFTSVRDGGFGGSDVYLATRRKL